MPRKNSAKPEIVDAHHHLWRYNPREYGWITPDMEVLQRNFLMADLEHEAETAGVDGTVVVQARQTIEETEWLLDLAERESCICGVVGWLPLLDTKKLERQLGRLAGREYLKGVRHVVQDEPDDDFILSAPFNEGVSMLNGTGLVYDILIHARHLDRADHFVKRHPKQVFVLNHLAKPRIRERDIDAWAIGIHRLAENPNVYCKLSGLATEADWSTWEAAQLKPYLDIALETFGADRLMCGSDWPVCLLATSYKHWWSTLYEWSSTLPAQQRVMLLGGTAKKVYNLS